MAKERNTSQARAGDGSTTNSDVNVALHNFSGNTCKIKLFKAEGTESKEVFVGLNHYHATLQRDKAIVVPVEVADHLESLAYTVKEPDPADPENPDKFVWVDKQRFPMQRWD